LAHYGWRSVAERFGAADLDRGEFHGRMTDGAGSPASA
jgi:hypothetical protein